MSPISRSHRARTGTRCLHGPVAVLVSILGLLAADVVLSPAGAAAPKRRLAKDLPALASPPAPPPKAEVPTGDFRNPPDPSQPRAEAPPRASFDPARSVPLDDETTETSRVWKNPDGTHTAEVSARPTRFRDESGAWRDLDVSLAPDGGGKLGAAAAPDAATLAPAARGDVATAQTSAGPIALRHPEAADVKATTDKATATYTGALPGGRDLALALTPDGFKETVVLPDAAAPPTYTDEFILPPGVTVQQGDDGVDFVDAAGTVVANYGGGMAFDATFEKRGLAAATPVSITVVSQLGSVAMVENGIDAAWLGAKDR